MGCVFCVVFLPSDSPSCGRFRPSVSKITTYRPVQFSESRSLTIGTTIDELIAINGDHIKFAGFGWDYEGTVLDRGNGKLKDKKISVRLTPDNYIYIDDFEGDDAVVSSSDPRIKQLGLYVSRFDIIF